MRIAPRTSLISTAALVLAATLATACGQSDRADDVRDDILTDTPHAIDPGTDATQDDATPRDADGDAQTPVTWPPGVGPIPADDPPVPLAGGLPAQTAFDFTNRDVVDLSGPWQFRFDHHESGVAEGWYRKEAARTGWPTIPVPAAWDLVLEDGFDHQGVGWYARKFTWDGDAPFVRLRFDGVFRDASVWLNGVELGGDDLPYLPFSFDVTDTLVRGAPNLLVVRIDNRLTRRTLPCDTTVNAGRHGWFPYGGITRPVVLEQSGATSVDRIHVRAFPDGDPPRGRIDARVFLHRRPGATAPVQVHAAVTRAGSTVLAWPPFEVPPDVQGLRLEGITPDATADTPGVTPWSPETPDAVYRLEVQLQEVRDPQSLAPERPPETVAVDFAFKRFQAENERFLLNGRDRWLRGINRHEDHPVLGPVFDADATAADAAAMRDLGIDFCRVAHYPNDVRTLRVLEQAGILLAQEIPVYQLDNEQLADPVLLDLADRALRRMIVRDVNRPGLAMWSIANEVWSFTDEAVPFFSTLAASARALDPDRPVMAALLTVPAISFSEADQAPALLDVIGINEYLGWYLGSTDELGAYLDLARQRYPGRTLFLSEFGADALRARHQWHAPGEEAHDDHSYSEEYQAWFLRQHLRQAASRDFVRGTMPWVLADFRMQWTPTTGRPHPAPGFNLKGVLDASRRPKLSAEVLRASYACGLDGLLPACEGESGLAVPPEPACGDGRTQPGETCDGGTRPCVELGASWADGIATCRDDCMGWNTADCLRAGQENQAWEMVKPGLRDPDRWADARCNDGTPYGFRVRVSPTGSRDWVISLRGGGFCDDYAVPCIRHDYLMSTPPQADRALWVPDDENGGVFDADPANNPVWHDANWVFAPYCSSDFFAGTRTDPTPLLVAPDGWFFAGRLNVQALLETLVRHYGLDDRSEHGARILFAGTSAGAVGVLATADLAAAQLPHAAAEGRLKILVDAGWLVHDWDEPDARLILADEPDRDVTRKAHRLYQARLNPRCESSRLAAGGHPGDCFLGLYAFGGLVDAPPAGLGLPVLFQQSLRDTSFSGFHNHDGDRDFEIRYGLRQWADALAADPDDALRAWWFLGHARYHDIHRWTGRWTKGEADHTFKDVLERFFAGGDPERVVWDPTSPPSGR